MGYFDGQVAWVTGGGRGIGRAAALALASQGAAVAVVSRTQSEMEEVIAEIRSHGGKAIASLLDVSNWDMVHGAVIDLRTQPELLEKIDRALHPD